jgi:glycosyltransferase involved in cell wall biosynthesis
VLPVFEEAATLPALVERLSAELRAAAPGDHEIVLVTSAAARDGTPACAAALAGRDPAVRLVRQAALDPGYGRALALGVAAARLPWLLLLDADGQLDPADLPRFVAAASRADVVLGRRVRRADRLGRRLASRLYHRFGPWLVGLPAGADADCGFKLLRRDLLGDAPLTSRTGVVNLELLARALARGARLVEVPVAHRPRSAGRSRFETELGLPTAAEVIAILRDLLALRVGLACHTCR